MNVNPILVAVALASAACAAAPRADGEPPAPVATAPAAAPATFANAAALLDAVERTSASLRDFQSAVTLETTDDVTGDTERRLGQVVFVQDEGKPATRRFAVVFEQFIDGAGRMDEKPMRYLYADGWLTEADFTQRTLIRRQLARPGEQYDPLKPGEGPVPLPIGQRRADVEARFEPSLADAPAAPGLRKLARPIAGVRLKPKPGMADRDLVEATVWYDAKTLAPVGVEATRRNGRTVVLLRTPKVNAGLDDAHRALLALAEGTTAGWRVDERPLAPVPGAAPAPASGATPAPAAPSERAP